jgi:LacI family transcriptional regulator
MSDRITLDDVATKSGFSRSTVSLVLQNSPVVAEKTREVVQLAASELGYVYNRAAASLRSKHSGIFGLLVNNVSNPFFGEIAVGVERMFNQGERTVMLGQHLDDVHAQDRLIKSMMEVRVDGLLIMAAYDTPAATFDLLKKWNVPTVLFNRQFPESNLPYVGTDNLAGTTSAADHLFAHDRTAIAFIGGRIGTYAHKERLAGVEKSMEAHGFKGDQVLKVGEGADHQSGYLAMQELIQKGYKNLGVLAYNDLVAFGAMAAIKDAHLKVGKDISIIGIDDIDASAYEDPSLTTVHADPQRVGETAANQVLEIVAGKMQSQGKTYLPNYLVVRESCGCSLTKGRFI